MTHQETEKKIREACPEIMGRHVFVVGYNRCDFCNEPRIIIDQKRDLIAQDKDSGGTLHEVSITEYCTETHPCPKNPYKEIGLPHVLRAIDQPKFFVDTDGWIGEMVKIDPMLCLRRIKWNLLKDWSGQSEKTKRFIGELLGGK